MEKFRLDKSPSAPPAYQQIIAFFDQQIKNRLLQPGEKLPPERDLAEEIGIARGTVKRAYEELVRRGLVEAFSGRGSFVAAEAVAPTEDRKDKAVRLIDQLLDQLSRLKFSAQDIRMFFDLRLLGREDSLRNLSVAAVDCNPETLKIFERQFLLIPNVNLAKIDLDDLFKDAGAASRLEIFDLVLTTTTHFQELVDRFPQIRNKAVQVAVAPTRTSIISLARLTPAQRIGILSESKRFQSIVLDHLRTFDIPAASVRTLFVSQLDRLDDFIASMDAVIVPAGYSLQKNREHLAALQAFTQRGGVIIPFDYQIERGSLLHVEERLRSLLDEDKRNGQ
ncbi:MAG: GntR family transcriptional regulator [Candidatus Aminicenantes bacterium]|nr:GntR family transcriptional regulator [Candidatus Aminicenantes bacterium]